MITFIERSVSFQDWWNIKKKKKKKNRKEKEKQKHSIIRPLTHSFTTTHALVRVLWCKMTPPFWTSSSLFFFLRFFSFSLWWVIDRGEKPHLDFSTFLQGLFFGFGLFGHAPPCPIRLFSLIITRFSLTSFFLSFHSFSLFLQQYVDFLISFCWWCSFWNFFQPSWFSLAISRFFQEFIYVIFLGGFCYSGMARKQQLYSIWRMTGWPRKIK